MQKPTEADMKKLKAEMLAWKKKREDPEQLHTYLIISALQPMMRLVVGLVKDVKELKRNALSARRLDISHATK